MTSKLSDLCTFADKRVAVADLDLDTYISTENMLPNKEGITCSARLPNVSQTQAYQVGDVLISNIRPYFRKIWFADCDGGCSNDVLVLRAKNNVYPNFLYYLLSDDNFFDYVTATAKGTKMPRGDKGAIMQYEVLDLPLDTQIRIAGTLSALDGRIANNTAINHHLEQMAQAIFKSWFVDFEPFGGEMPNDWQKGMLGDYCSVKSGFAFKSSWWQESGIRVIKIKNITDNGFNFTGCSCVSEDKIIYAKDFTTTAGDLLIAMTGATIGKFAIIPQHNEILLINQRVGKFFLGTNPLMKLPFLWCLLRQDEVFNEIVNRGQGSAQPNISPTDIMTISIILPSEGALLNFNDSLRSCFETMIANSAENQKLADLRDTLLPRLMSGELSVADLGDAK
ncbi:restriction endonuclease subunit S [Salmonella enterica subsp. enterica]|nr:restriction endonuclease subunit S [Salmonella enterica subsp. enterica serovar Poona]EBU7356295.1 restriction endonuclease subunit S [Salmonella enterica subsp. enterica serovar Poona]ECA2556993.1 restriction endonuclease subunit S [Salmonella enterica subsp. enterica serovar Poona]